MITHDTASTSNVPGASGWEVMHRAALKLSYHLREGLPIEPVLLNPLSESLATRTIAWGEQQQARASDDLAVLERCLAHHQIDDAIRTLSLLLRRLERPGLRERCDETAVSANTERPA